MLQIVIDSAGDLPEGWIDEYNIHIIPLNIHFGEQTFFQGIDLSNADFYRIADESGVIPKTSQPTPQQFVDFYKRVALPEDTVISIHVTGKLSGTLASAELAARELADEYNIIPLDSASGSAAMGYMCREIRTLESQGATVEQIVERIKFIARNVQIILTLDTMEYARKSGRVKALQAALASLLNVKPIVILNKGVLEVGDRVRTRGKSLEYIVDLIAQRMSDRRVNAAVVHSEDPKAGELLMEAVRARLNWVDLIMTELSIGIAANLGPGTVGVIAYPLEGE